MKDYNWERYSFLWSEARLIIGSIALLIGGVPPVLFILPFSATASIVSFFLRLAWIISGVASAYLLMRWYKEGMVVFRKKDWLDILALFVSIVSGLNLGFTGLFGENPGMTINSSYPIFLLTAVIYVATAVYLYKRWNEHSQKLFR